MDERVPLLNLVDSSCRACRGCAKRAFDKILASSIDTELRRYIDELELDVPLQASRKQKLAAIRASSDFSKIDRFAPEPEPIASGAESGDVHFPFSISPQL